MQVYGIDLSMEKFDVNFINQTGKEKKKQVKNQLGSISTFLEELPKDAILCAEYTGTYADLLVYLCNQFNIKVAMVPGYTIKHSIGMAKGKSDDIDAGRIREYGERFFDRLEFKQYDSEVMSELKSLYTLRTQLVKARKVLKTGEHGRSYVPIQNINVHNHVEAIICKLNHEIEEVESEIKAVIKANDELSENYELAVSVKGIGPVIATDLIIKTGNFEIIDTARKASSYAGICPFPNASGKLVGKSKISSFGDRKLKALLYMGAKSAVKYNKEYRFYYEKKKLEGKPHFLIMNNISNKILRTIFSVIKNKTPYDPNYICLDPREKNVNNSTEKVA